METLQEYIRACIEKEPYRCVLSAPSGKGNYMKTVIQRIGRTYQCENYTDTQVFHENLEAEHLAERLCGLLGTAYTQLHAWDGDWEYALRITKKGKIQYSRKKSVQAPPVKMAHNRKKRYLIEENTVVPPLVDMGIFTAEGRVVRSMYDKFRQINRFLELLNDELGKLDLTRRLRILDFGCGKSYLTFIVYYYLVCVRGLDATVTGLDLKEDVIRRCNAAAEKYRYGNLHFEKGDIKGYSPEGEVDIVITLHACDTATDYALYNAVKWNAKLILSVPCCQHELNGQIRSETFGALMRYGIVKERMAALMTDAIRANLLITQGYDTQLLEFVDLSHTPKNLLIRAVRTGTGVAAREKAMAEVESLRTEFGAEPTLYGLLAASEKEEKSHIS
ncbi:MAG TPA: SAM-dependent methyltransferase [Lachnospiraceae bacterium]|nr:SAM-dependent methyltransferase [Lachnospiraceae bacterium]